MSIYVSIDGTEHVASIEGQHINSDLWLLVKEVLTRNGTSVCVCVCVCVRACTPGHGESRISFQQSAGGTGLSWIPVPTKLFQDRGGVV